MSDPSLLRRGRRHAVLAPVAAVLVLALTLVTTLSLARPAAAVAPHSFADPIFSTDARGDITTIGNVTTTCDPTYANQHWSAAESAAACNGARSGATGTLRFDGAAMPPINNRLAMQHVDVDGDPSTFASSTADLHIPTGATVLWAGLHWNAATDVPSAPQLYGSTYEAAPPNVADRFRVRFTTPASGSSIPLDASPADGTTRDTWDDTNAGGTTSYGAFVDVTAQVRAGGAGRYGVADVQSCQGFGGCFGSWSLTVAFADRDLPARNLNVWHGWQVTTPTVNGGAQEFTVGGITPPPSGPVNARIGVVQADGDRGLGPDSLDISSPSHPAWATFHVPDRPLAPGEADWFNSTVNAFGHRRSGADAQPNHLSNLNQDVALVQHDQIIGNADHTVSFKVQTASSESLYSQVVHSAVDLYEPEIGLAKAVAPAGPVRAGEEVTWTLTATNDGIDPVRHAVVTDPLPAGLTYVPGSIRYAAGGPANLLGPKTDGPGDDQAEWAGGTRTLTFRIGAGADGTDGGTMGLAPAPDSSDRLTITFRTIVDGPPDRVTTNVAHAHGEGRELDDPFGPLVTDAEDRAVVTAAPEADLGIAKTDGGAVVRAVGDRFTYRLTATNGGPSAATGVTMEDRLDEHLRFVGSTDGCTAVGRVVRCDVGALAAGASADRAFEVAVVDLPGPGRAIPNTATIEGDQPNPDCTDPTPDARCNHDEEETPQPAVDLGITKSDGDAVVRQVGDEYAYRLTVTNAGPDEATEVTITDELDPRIAFVSSERCGAEAQVVTCRLGKLAPDATVDVDVRVRVRALPQPGGSIPNLATVRGGEPDPDCDRTTPDARCNHDEEDTPRAEPPTIAERPPSTPIGALPRTGATVVGLVAVGAATVVIGAVVLVVRRRAAR
jgi:uncharacterized repeat protein (TIGR01451 family)/LPXTG-motif cell wall-anchored protein